MATSCDALRELPVCSTVSFLRDTQIQLSVHLKRNFQRDVISSISHFPICAFESKVFESIIRLRLPWLQDGSTCRPDQFVFIKWTPIDSSKAAWLQQSIEGSFQNVSGLQWAHQSLVTGEQLPEILQRLRRGCELVRYVAHPNLDLILAPAGRALRGVEMVIQGLDIRS